jgi:hypothetical protein
MEYGIVGSASGRLVFAVDPDETGSLLTLADGEDLSTVLEALGAAIASASRRGDVGAGTCVGRISTGSTLRIEVAGGSTTRPRAVVRLSEGEGSPMGALAVHNGADAAALLGVLGAIPDIVRQMRGLPDGTPLLVLNLPASE